MIEKIERLNLELIMMMFANVCYHLRSTDYGNLLDQLFSFFFSRFEWFEVCLEDV